jgi:hypothetical protein
MPGIGIEHPSSAVVAARLERLLVRVLEAEERIIRLLEKFLHSNRIIGFEIYRKDTMNPLAPGTSAVYTATPIPATAVPSTPPTWTSSDPVNAPVTADSTGLIGTVNPPTSAPIGTNFTLTVNYTNADSSVATGSITDTIVAPGSPDITAFTITRTA